MTVFAKDVVKNVGSGSGVLVKIPLNTGTFSSLKSQYRGLQGHQYQSNGKTAAHDRYGWPDGSIPGTLLLQGTDWSKKVKVTSVIGGTSIVEEVTLYLRIFRELRYRDYATTKPLDSKYVVTKKETFIDDFSGSGSNGFPSSIAAWGTGGYYTTWWVLWTGLGGQKGALIDWASHGISGRGEFDKNTFSGSPKINGISNFHSATSGWQSPWGLEIYESDDLTFYINDAGDAPTKTTDKLTSPPVVIRSPNTVNGTQSIRYVESRSSASYSKQQPGMDAYGVLPGSSQGITSFQWSNIDYYSGNTWVPVAVSNDDYERIKILKDKSAFPAQPTKIGNTTMTSANWVVGNINFSTDPAKGAKNWWVGNPVNSTGSTWYIKPIVVDGQSISQADPKTGNTGTYAPGRDSTWLAGYDDPSDYWYILPQVQRSNVSGCCANKIGASVLTTEQQAVGVFVSPSSECGRGMHFGKFLKTAFSQNDLYAWTTFIEGAGKQSASSVSVNTLFTGYRQTGGIRTGADMYSPTYTLFTFSLRGLPEFSGYTSAVVVGGAGGSTTTPTIDPNDTTIRTALNAALSSKAVNVWTVSTIQAFAKTQATALGRPLFDIKSELLTLFFDAKVKWYKDEEDFSYQAAMSKAANDPVYKALVGLFATTTGGGAPSGGGGGGTRTQGSGSTTGTSPGENTNQTKTIRITVTRGLPGYKPGVRQSAVTSDKPELVQTYEYFERLPDGSDIGRTAMRRFTFPFVPREVNYSGLGAQWTEIERTGNFPIVDWQSFQLLKISFNFDIVDRSLENQTGFGLYWSCEDQIRVLREMAQSPYPVTFLNMDQFMSEEVRYPLFTRGRGIEFVIAEFSVTSVQRTPYQAASISGQLTPNQISRATASMTLQEIPIEAIDIVQMPPIKPCNKKNKKCDDPPPPPPPGERSYVLFTPSVSR